MALIAGVVGGAVVVALLCAGAIVVWLRRGGKSVAKIAPHSHGVINPPGEWDFFLSHTQRDGAATMLCELLFNSFKEMGFTVWLDVRMDKRDMAAMEEGAKNCKCFLAIVTDNGADSYFSREMCRKEIRWAQEAERKIVPVCSQADKGRIGQFIQESLVQEVDFSAYNFVVRPSPAPPAPQFEVARASLLTVRPDTPAGRRPLGSESAQGLARRHHRPGGLGQGSREEGRLSQVCRFEAGLLHRRDIRHQDPGG